MRPAIISGISAIALAVGSWAVPVVFPHVEVWVAKDMLWTAGALLVLAFLIWLWGLRRHDPHEGGISATGPNSLAVGNVAGDLNYNAPPLPPKFSAVAEVNTVPPFLGGCQVLDLAGLATLKLHVPYNETSVTMVLDPVVLREPDQTSDEIEVRAVTTQLGPRRKFVFDSDAKRHTMEAGGKVFIVTLREIANTPIEGIAKVLRFTFAVAEV